MKLKHPVAIVTRVSLEERDIDLLASLAGDGLTLVGISVITLNTSLAHKFEPSAPSSKRRMMMIERLSKAGKDAGTKSVRWISLRLPREVCKLFQD